MAIAVVSLSGAVAIGIGAAAAWGWGLLVFVAVGAVLVPAYNLELALHTDWGFALCWGAFPALTGYFVEAQTLRVEAVLRRPVTRSRSASRSVRCRRRSGRHAANARPPRALSRSSVRCGCSPGLRH